MGPYGTLLADLPIMSPQKQEQQEQQQSKEVTTRVKNGHGQHQLLRLIYMKSLRNLLKCR
jgi:hypothetical protein